MIFYNTDDVESRSRGKIVFLFCLMVLLCAELSVAGPYTDSAHGNTTVGVSRADTASAGYYRGNCAHCHEQHGSLGGSEPAPSSGSPSSFSLYAQNFNTAVTGPPYAESDNICFSCHDDFGSIMQVTNNSYAQTFGGYTPGDAVNSIMDSYTVLKNSHTEHNLKDVYNYAKLKFAFFSDSSNPCVACHNPHLAKRNNSDPDNPAMTAISRPTDHENLWGDEAGETMADAVGAETYQPPYYWGSANYEPGGVIDHDGSKMPDYNTFCLDCHGNADVYSSTFGRNLNQIDWSSSGDIHGARPRYSDQYVAGAVLKLPYDTALGSTTPNYVLSCMDCHEAHGTPLYNYLSNSVWYYSSLIRKSVNAREVDCYGCGGWTKNDADWTMMGLCLGCHDVTQHNSSPWECSNCHYHGAINASWGNRNVF